MTKKIAIIGASGMLGFDLVKYLGKDFSVTAITKETYQKSIGKHFDIVINANGNSKRFWANQHVFEDFTLSTLSVYKNLVDFHFDQYIYISSSDVYNNHAKQVLTKEDQVIKYDKLSAYGFHKYLSENIVRHLAKKYIIIRSSMMLGTNLKKGPIFDILERKPLYISRKSQIQMITTSEMARVLTFFIKRKIVNQTYNVGGKGAVPFKDIQNFFSPPVLFEKNSQTQIYNMNVSKLMSLYPLKTSKQYLQDFIDSLQSE